MRENAYESETDRDFTPENGRDGQTKKIEDREMISKDDEEKKKTRV